MKIAFISDIHANSYALKKVLDNIEKQGISEIICLGDLVGDFIFPDQVINILREKEILTIQGEFDEAIASSFNNSYRVPPYLERSDSSLICTHRTISDSDREWLRSLQKNHYLQVNKKSILLTHNSPRSNIEDLNQDKNVQEILEEFKFDIMVCGHSHQAGYKKYGNRYIVNAGSVGKPDENNNISYVVLDLKKDNLEIEINELPYDKEAALKGIEKYRYTC